MVRRFKVGDKVRIKRDVDRQAFREFGSEGKIGKTYTICEEGASNVACKFKGSNWHRHSHIEFANLKILIGGNAMG